MNTDAMQHLYDFHLNPKHSYVTWQMWPKISSIPTVDNAMQLFSELFSDVTNKRLKVKVPASGFTMNLVLFSEKRSKHGKKSAADLLACKQIRNKSPAKQNQTILKEQLRVISGM